MPLRLIMRNKFQALTMDLKGPKAQFFGELRQWIDDPLPDF